MIYVLYHGDCMDGYGSAWAAYDFWSSKDEEVEYIPVTYGKPCPISPTLDDFVFMVDFSYSEEDILKMLSTVKHLTILDHHKTTQENIQHLIDKKYTNLEIVFDMNRSGALITWQYFHDEPEEAPMLIQHISDRDLWKFEMDGTREIHACLRSHPRTFEMWYEINENINKYYAQGRAIVRYETHTANVVATTQSLVKEIKGYQCAIATVPYFMASDVCHHMLDYYGDKIDFAATWFITGDGNQQWSIRSEGDFDVSEVARLFGGGGHKNASGFMLTDPHNFIMGFGDKNGL